jgi:AmiR/NasT family two-component response regulator
VESGSRDFQRGDLARLEAVQREFDAQVQRFDAEAQRLAQARARLREILEQSRKGRSEREVLHDSAYARLQARLETMPVIEQAKGILMAQHRCGADEAFDLLRRASQRANVKVSVLAAQMVEQIASPRSDR